MQSWIKRVLIFLLIALIIYWQIRYSPELDKGREKNVPATLDRTRQDRLSQITRSIIVYFRNKDYEEEEEEKNDELYN